MWFRMYESCGYGGYVRLLSQSSACVSLVARVLPEDVYKQDFHGRGSVSSECIDNDSLLLKPVP